METRESAGIYDVLGKEICVGDILLNHSFGDLWEVCFEDGEFVAKILETYDPKRHTAGLYGLVDFEVIGSKFGNPELME